MIRGCCKHSGSIRTLLAALLLSATQFVSAQAGTDQRAVATKIADALAKFPAQTKEQLDNNLKTLLDLDESGLTQMAGMLSAPGKGDNTSLEYAISGISSYVMEKGNEDDRKKAIRVYIGMLDNDSLGLTKAFFIRQLQAIGNDDAVPALGTSLNTAQFAGFAARALARIGSPAAGKTLLEALPKSTDSTRLSIIEALGYMKYEPAVPGLTAFADSEDPALRKVSLYALAAIADPGSQKTLLNAAAKGGFGYEPANTVPAYLLYIKNLQAKGQGALALQLAENFRKQAEASKVLHVRIAALKLMADIQGNKMLPALYKAVSDKDPEYRAAALNFSVQFRDKSVNKDWLKLARTVSPEARVQVIDHLAGTSDKDLLPALYKLLNDKDLTVRVAAIAAVGSIGQDASLPVLLNKMKNGSPEEMQAVKQSLLLMKGNEIGKKLLPSLNEMPPAAQVALLNVLAARGTVESANDVLKLVNASDTSVHAAAILALPAIATRKELPELFKVLNTSSDADIETVQQAMINSSSEISDTAERTTAITAEMERAAPEKQYAYLNILGTIGGKQAMDVILQKFNTGEMKTRTAAVKALSLMNDNVAASTLLKIAKGKDAGLAKQALDGYIGMIEKSSQTPDQKVLMLTEAMEVASDPDQRKKILKLASSNHTFLSLVFAGKFLDDTQLQQEAAQAVLSVTRSNKDIYGEIAKALINKTIEVIKGADSDYQKQDLRKILEEMTPGPGFVSIFNGKDLAGWKGLVADPIKRQQMSAAELKAAQAKADEVMKTGWEVKDGLLVFTGHGENLATEKSYGDFEMLVDWKITKGGDAGVYLRGTPQVQIWDTARRDVGAQVGSGGLYNNEKHPSKPLEVADNAVDEWNTFRILMKGDKVTVHLNGKLVTDNTVLENYWDRKLPIFPEEQIELQAHGTYVAYRNVYIREIPRAKTFVLSLEEKKAGYEMLFDGTGLDAWQGDTSSYKIEEGNIVVRPSSGGGGNLFTKQEYSDFIFRFDFQLTPGANNGLGIRAPLEGDAAYTGMEIQILDNDAEIYKNLKQYQYHGSVYGIIPAKRGFLRPLGEWNTEEVYVKGSKIRVTLNNQVILDGDLAKALKDGALDKLEHPGAMRKTGHIGFLGHGSVVKFRNIRVKALKK